MTKLIIFGTTSFSKMIARYIELENVAEVMCFCVDSQYIKETTILDKPVVPFEDIGKLYPNTEHCFLNTIGYTKMNSLRNLVTEKCLKKGYRMFNYISTHATVYSEITGYNNIVLPKAFIGFDVNMGNNNVCYSGCVLTHDIEIGNNNFFAANSTVGGNVRIENNCFFGMNCTVKNRIIANDKSLVGAGAYLDHDTTIGEVVVPVRSITLNKSSEELI